MFQGMWFDMQACLLCCITLILEPLSCQQFYKPLQYFDSIGQYLDVTIMIKIAHNYHDEW